MRCWWSDTGRYLGGDFFLEPEVSLTISNGKTAQKAVAQAFENEDEMVEKSTPKPGERSYGIIGAKRDKGSFSYHASNVSSWSKS